MKPSTDTGNKNSKSIVSLIDLHHSSQSLIKRLKNNSIPTEIITFPDPAGIERQYLAIDSHIYEIQSIPHIRSPKYSSFFVGSYSVLSDPHLHLLHRIDPLFFILSKFKPNSSHTTEQHDATHCNTQWQPWNQLVQTYSINQSVLDAIPPQTLEKQLDHFFQRSDQFGDDLILYRFKEEKVSNWLKLKMKRIISNLREKEPAGFHRDDVDMDGDGTTGAFSSSFRPSSRSIVIGDNDKQNGSFLTKDENDNLPAISPDNDTQIFQQQIEKEEEKYLKYSAVQILCEYLSPAWQTFFLQSLNMTEDDVLCSAAIVKKRRREELLRAGDVEKKQKFDDTMTQITVDETNKDFTINNGRDRHPSMVTPPPRADKGFNIGDDELTLSEADKLQIYTMGGGGKGDKNGSTARGTKMGSGTKSAAVKRLEKVNTKGMRSLTSFFGAAAGKKGGKKT